MPLEVCFCALAARADRDGVILERRARRRKFKQMRTSTVLSDDEEADTVWAAPVFLRVDLCLYWLWDPIQGQRGQLGDRSRNRMADALSAMADTRRLTGAGRLKIILEAMACWRMKLLHRWTHTRMSIPFSQERTQAPGCRIDPHTSILAHRT